MHRQTKLNLWVRMRSGLILEWAELDTSHYKFRSCFRSYLLLRFNDELRHA